MSIKSSLSDGLTVRRASQSSALGGSSSVLRGPQRYCSLGLGCIGFRPIVHSEQVGCDSPILLMGPSLNKHRC
ncbi:hypothetical protein Pint_31622 [Pistacia integerrima]|uniref:Uncharacterized protein n=1 Tax=Pistacia integerrima TaxID=434235 RepID=A0ACC0XQX5_9ROSI|nr:hypothetical protein Pint_31622 [Pistacia integerrima]